MSAKIYSVLFLVLLLVVIAGVGSLRIDTAEHFAACAAVAAPSGAVVCPQSHNWTCINARGTTTPMRVSSATEMVECAATNGGCMQLSSDQCNAWTSTNNDPNYVASTDLANQYTTVQCGNECNDPSSACAQAWTQFSGNCLPPLLPTVPS